MTDLLQTGGASGAGAIVGAIATFFGLKTQIRSIDKKLENVVFKDTCTATVTGIHKELETQTNLMSEMRKDIKELLRQH